MPTTDYTREWILHYVREAFQNRPPQFQMTFEEYIERLWSTLEKAGIPDIRKKPAGFDGTHYDVSAAPDQIRHSALEAINYLLTRGLIIPIPSTPITPWRNKEGYIWTKRGAEWATGNEPLPEDSVRYLALLKHLVPGLDPVIEQYVSEGLSSFARGHYFAAAVMVGAASEKIIYMLGDSMHGAFSATAKQSQLRSLLDGRSLKKLFEFLLYEIEDAAKRKAIPYPVHEGAVPHVGSLITAVRVQRNDAVHPQNAAVTPESVRLSYNAFPQALEKMETLQGWFNKNPGSI